MITAAFVAGFILTIFICLGIILLKWIIAQVGVNLFVLLMFLTVSVFLLIFGEEKYDE